MSDDYIQEPAQPQQASLPRAAWWPKNPYRGDTGRNYNDNFRREGYEMALKHTWHTFCDWLDACQAHHFEALLDRLDLIRYPEVLDERSQHSTHPVDDRRRQTVNLIDRCKATYGHPSDYLRCVFLRGHAGAHWAGRDCLEWEMFNANQY